MGFLFEKKQTKKHGRRRLRGEDGSFVSGADRVREGAAVVEVGRGYRLWMLLGTESFPVLSEQGERSLIAERDGAPRQ